MINIRSIKRRIARQNEKRFGISVVYGLPIHITLVEFTKSLKKYFGKKYHRIFNWNKKRNFHATIIRCDSVKKVIHIPPALDLVRDMFKSVTSFYLVPDKVELLDDGVIRLSFQKVTQLSNINKYYLNKFARAHKLSINVKHKPWLKLANIHDVNVDLNTDELYELILKWNQNMTNDLKPIFVTSLKAVYYRDINFIKRKTLLLIEL